PVGSFTRTERGSRRRALPSKRGRSRYAKGTGKAARNGRAGPRVSAGSRNRRCRVGPWAGEARGAAEPRAAARGTAAGWGGDVAAGHQGKAGSPARIAGQDLEVHARCRTRGGEEEWR